MAYLMIAEKQHTDLGYGGWYNVGPDDCDCVTTGKLADIFCSAWGNDARWENKWTGGPHEANFLKLDCSKLKSTFGWKPKWNISDAVQKTCEWTKTWLNGGNIPIIMDKQIEEYMNGGKQ